MAIPRRIYVYMSHQDFEYGNANMPVDRDGTFRLRKVARVYGGFPSFVSTTICCWDSFLRWPRSNGGNGKTDLDFCCRVAGEAIFANTSILCEKWLWLRYLPPGKAVSTDFEGRFNRLAAMDASIGYINTSPTWTGVLFRRESCWHTKAQGQLVHLEGYYNQGMGNATIMVYEAVIKIAEGRVVRFEIED